MNNIEYSVVLCNKRAVSDYHKTPVECHSAAAVSIPHTVATMMTYSMMSLVVQPSILQAVVIPCPASSTPTYFMC